MRLTSGLEDPQEDVTLLRSPGVRVDFLPPSESRLGAPIGLTEAPGKRRSLEEDLKDLRETHGTALLVSLVGDTELEYLKLTELEARVRASTIDLVRFPIADFSTPNSPADFEALLTTILARTRRGDTVVVHCWQGLGRSGLVVECCLVKVGHGAQEAMAMVRRCRPGAIEDSDQEEYIAKLAEQASLLRGERA